MSTTTAPILTDCDDCGGEGFIEWSSDHFSPVSGHYMRGGTKTCDACHGTGTVIATCTACSGRPATQGTDDRWNAPNPYLCAECAAEIKEAA